MAISGQAPSEVHLNGSSPEIPAGALGVTFQAGAPYADPNNPTLQVRDVSAYAADVENAYNVRNFGATGAGVADDYEAIYAAMAAAQTAGGGTVYFPDGVYLVKTALVIPALVSVRCSSPNAIIRAGASMTTLLSTASTQVTNQAIVGGTWDGNGLAVQGIFVRWIAHFSVRDTSVINCYLASGIAYYFGDASLGTSYELMAANLRAWNPSTVTAVGAGSIGLYLGAASDSSIGSSSGQSVFVGFQIGVRVDSSHNSFFGLHPWSFVAQGQIMTVAFFDNASHNNWIACEADTPSQYGWHCTGYNTFICGGVVYVNSTGTNNTVVGVYFDTAEAGPYSTLMGVAFQGADGTHTLASDVGGTAHFNQNALTKIGTSITSVTAPLPDSLTGHYAPLLNLYGPTVADVLTFQGAYQQTISANAGSNRLQIDNVIAASEFAAVQLWRNTTTAGRCAFYVYRGDGSSTVNHYLFSDATQGSYLCGISGGKLGVGQTSPAYTLDVLGDINTSTLYRAGGTAGVTGGPYSNATVTVQGGIITAASAGTAAAAWLSGAGAPGTISGQANGDYYLDTAGTGNVYELISGTWTLQCSIQGPGGAAGARGSLWYSGSGAPGTISGQANGDWYLNTANGDVYKLVSGTWTLEGNITGPAGSGGAGWTQTTVAGSSNSLWGLNLFAAGSLTLANYHTATVRAILSQTSTSTGTAGIALEMSASSGYLVQINAGSTAQILYYNGSFTTPLSFAFTSYIGVYRVEFTVTPGAGPLNTLAMAINGVSFGLVGGESHVTLTSGTISIYLRAASDSAANIDACFTQSA